MPETNSQTAWHPCRFYDPDGKGRIRFTDDLVIADIRVEEIRTVIIGARDSVRLRFPRRGCKEPVTAVAGIIALILLGAAYAFPQQTGTFLLLACSVALIGLFVALLFFVVMGFPRVTQVILFPIDSERPIKFEFLKPRTLEIDQATAATDSTPPIQHPVNREWLVFDSRVHYAKRGAIGSFVIFLFLTLAVLVISVSPMVLLLSGLPFIGFAIWGFRERRRALEMFGAEYLSAHTSFLKGDDDAARQMLNALLQHSTNQYAALFLVVLSLMESDFARAANACDGHTELNELLEYLRQIADRKR